MQSTHTALLPNTQLPKAARVVHLFPKMKRFLVSLGQFCDSGMTIYLTKTAITIYKSDTDRTVTLRGTRSKTDGMWYLELKPTAPPTPTCHNKISNSVHELNKKEDVIKYLSTVMWNPVPETWIKAIDAGFFATWPGLTSQLVKKHLSRTIETDMGHLRADRKNTRSTKPVQPNIEKRTNDFYVKTIELTGKLCSDQTGRFPVMSSKGTKCVMVTCDHDSNSILAKPLRTKSSTEHL